MTITDGVRVDPVKDAIVHLAQLEPLAAEALAGPVWDYVAGGAADETTLADSNAAWARIKLAPRALVDVSRIDTHTQILGLDLQHPIIVAPTARHTAYHADGETATIRGTRQGEALYIQSSLGGTALDVVGDVARDAGQPWWFQLYVQRDRGWTRELVARAIDAGAQALALTVDTPTLGARDRDKRDNLGAAAGAIYPILDGAPVAPDPTPAHRRIYNPHLSPDITWADLEWLAEISSIPVIPKGVLRADDARKAVSCGAAAIIVSNHGARNLDTVPTTAEALSPVVAAVADRVPVIVDGGIRRGTDVVKALIMGASAVMIGRPVIWGLATYGQAGVTHVIEMLRTELEMAMALLGAPAISQLTDELLWDRYLDSL